ncbi:DsbA family protein [Thalassobaculum sp.]|uniref:DsbA family protein n=1 Tax=Thalassobaculum sp. TaxID=2022740 RepID=UPI0032EBFA95
MPFVRRLSAAALVAGMLVGGAPVGAAEPFTAEQKTAIEALIRDYILKHPEVLLESVASIEARQKAQKEQAVQAAIAENLTVLERSSGDPVLGNPNGDVTVVEFFDYQCGYCKTMMPPLMELVHGDGNIRLVLKEFPILGPASVVAARASLAANMQGKYEPFHVTLMGLRGRLSEGAIWQAASEAGLDLDRLKKDMEDPAVTAIIDANYKLAQALQIEGTPAFTVGRVVVPGAAPKEHLAALVKKAREAGG